MKKNIIQEIQKLSTFPPENLERLVSWWKNNQPISFYSWECPPRKISLDKKGDRFVDFDVDVRSIVWGRKIDKFTEIPRVNLRQKDEKWFVNTIILPNPKATYLKLIADTNGYYLYPQSLKIFGEKKLKTLYSEFKKELKLFSSQKINKRFPKFILFTEIQKNYQKEYEAFFNFVYQSFDENLRSKLVKKDILGYWKTRVLQHVGLPLKMVEERKNLVKRIIASYATEGMIFELTSQSGVLPNPVWVNWEEEPELAKTTDLLRKRCGLEPIPKIYFVKK